MPLWEAVFWTLRGPMRFTGSYTDISQPQGAAGTWNTQPWVVQTSRLQFLRGESFSAHGPRQSASSGLSPCGRQRSPSPVAIDSFDSWLD